MCTVVLNDILSNSANLPDAGMKFYDIIKDALDKSEKVIVNMANVTALPSIFLNVSIGKVIEVYGTDRLRHNLSYINITKGQAMRFRDYVTNYKA